MLVGRQYEQKLLLEIAQSDKSEFVAVYGRRRVGKTYLIRETFNYNFAFQHTGVQDGDKDVQLSRFAKSLENAGMSKCKKLNDWFDAFDALGGQNPVRMFASGAEKLSLSNKLNILSFFILKIHLW